MHDIFQAIGSFSFVDTLAQIKTEVVQPQFWVGLSKIIWINILLSGDNALVIALACRGLPPKERRLGMVIGAGIAVVLLILFTGIVAQLMTLPFLKLVGGVALVVIAAKLLVPDDGDGHVAQGTNLWHAVRIVVIADIIMSLDNVIAVAAAANGQLTLLIVGLAVSIPMIIAGAALIMAILDRLPILVWLGAVLLGWIGGAVIATDPAVAPRLHAMLNGDISINVDTTSPLFGFVEHLRLGGEVDELIFAVLGVIVVLTIGTIWRRRKLEEIAAASTEAEVAPATT